MFASGCLFSLYGTLYTLFRYVKLLLKLLLFAVELLSQLIKLLFALLGSLLLSLNLNASLKSNDLSLCFILLDKGEPGTDDEIELSRCVGVDGVVFAQFLFLIRTGDV